MTDQLTESAPESVEPQAQPTPKISQPSGDKQTSQAPDLDQLAEKLASKVLPILQEQAKKEAQSVKDRRFSAFEQDMERVKAYLDAAGGDTRKASRDMALDNLINQQSSPQANPGGSVWGEWRETRDQILKSAAEDLGVQIAWNDPEVLQVAGGEYERPADVVTALNRVVYRRAKKAGVSPAAVASEGSGSAQSQADDHSALSAQLEHARQTGAPRKQREELMAKLKEAIARAE